MASPEMQRRVGQLRHDVDDVYELLDATNEIVRQHSARLEEIQKSADLTVGRLDRLAQTQHRMETAQQEQTTRLQRLEQTQQDQTTGLQRLEQTQQDQTTRLQRLEQTQQEQTTGLQRLEQTQQEQTTGLQRLEQTQQDQTTRLQRLEQTQQEQNTKLDAILAALRGDQSNGR